MKLRGIVIDSALPIAAVVTLSAATASAFTVYYFHHRTRLITVLPVGEIKAVISSEESSGRQYIISNNLGDRLEQSSQPGNRTVHPDTNVSVKVEENQTAGSGHAHAESLENVCKSHKKSAKYHSSRDAKKKQIEKLSKTNEPVSDGSLPSCGKNLKLDPARSQNNMDLGEMSNTVKNQPNKTVSCHMQEKSLENICKSGKKSRGAKKKQMPKMSTTNNSVDGGGLPTCEDSSTLELAHKENNEIQMVSQSTMKSLGPNIPSTCNSRARGMPFDFISNVPLSGLSSILCPTSITSKLIMTQPMAAKLNCSRMLEQNSLGVSTRPCVSNSENKSDGVLIRPANGAPKIRNSKKSRDSLPKNGIKGESGVTHERSASLCGVVDTKLGDAADEEVSQTNLLNRSNAVLNNVMGEASMSMPRVTCPVASSFHPHCAPRNGSGSQQVEDPSESPSQGLRNTPCAVQNYGLNQEPNKRLCQNPNALLCPVSNGESCKANDWQINKAQLSWVVFWDLENVSIPKGIPTPQFVCALRNFLSTCRRHGSIDPVLRITVVANPNRMTGEMRAQLHSSGVTVVQVQAGARKDVSDKALLTDLCLLPLYAPPPLGVAILSGDIDFSYAIARLSALTYYTVVVAPDNSFSSLLCSAPTRFVPLSLILTEVSHSSYVPDKTFNDGLSRWHQGRQTPKRRKEKFRPRRLAPVRNSTAQDREAKRTNCNNTPFRTQTSPEVQKDLNISSDMTAHHMSHSSSQKDSESNTFFQCSTTRSKQLFMNFNILWSSLQSFFRCSRWIHILLPLMIFCLCIVSLYRFSHYLLP